MAALLRLTQKRCVDVVIETHLDRLTRSLHDLTGLITLFRKSNVALVSLHERLDISTDSGDLVANCSALSHSGARHHPITDTRRDGGL